MFKKITALTIIGGLFISSGTFAFTAADVQTANYLANQGIIKNWSSSPETYHLDSYMARAGVMGMVVNMTGVAVNANCRGDFSDVRNSTVNDEYICRIIETAADNNFINAQRGLPKNMRKVRPYERVTHSEAVGILMKGFTDTGAWTGYSYYWDANFPTEGDSIGYRNAYNFGATWQATVMYSYVRKVLRNDLALRSDPLVNYPAQAKEVFDFAKEIIN